MRHHSTARWLTGLLLAGLAMAGCGTSETNDPEQGPIETATVAETPTSAESDPAPGPTPWPEPVRPDAMDQDDAEGAQAAVEYFLALYPYTFATGDLEVWQEMSHPECRFCASVVDRVEDLHRGGGYGSGGQVTVEEFRTLPPDDEFQHYRVGIRGTEEPSASHSASGEILDSSAGGDVFYTLGVVYDESWLVRGMALEDVP